MRSNRTEIAQRMHHLGWCLFITCIVQRSESGAALSLFVLAAPAALIGANELRRLAPLLDRPAARSYLEWASIACGGVAVAGTLQFAPGASDAGRLAVIVLGSTAVSLYALGLASWTTSVNSGRLARRLWASVACWWVFLATVGIAYVAASPPTEPFASGRWTLGSRVVPFWVIVLTVGAAAASYWLLVGAHHVIKTAMRELAAEDEAHVSTLPTA